MNNLWSLDNFGGWTRREIERAETSVFELAFHCGLSEDTIRMYKEGKAIPSFRSAIYLCDALARLQNSRLGLKLSRPELRMLSDKLLIEISRII